MEIDMYKKRHMWATAHIRGKFFAGFSILGESSLRGLGLPLGVKACTLLLQDMLK